jgi:hypothetical protein
VSVLTGAINDLEAARNFEDGRVARINLGAGAWTGKVVPHARDSAEYREWA